MAVVIVEDVGKAGVAVADHRMVEGHQPAVFRVCLQIAFQLARRVQPGQRQVRRQRIDAAAFGVRQELLDARLWLLHEERLGHGAGFGVVARAARAFAQEEKQAFEEGREAVGVERAMRPRHGGVRHVMAQHPIGGLGAVVLEAKRLHQPRAHRLGHQAVEGVFGGDLVAVRGRFHAMVLIRLQVVEVAGGGGGREEREELLEIAQIPRCHRSEARVAPPRLFPSVERRPLEPLPLLHQAVGVMEEHDERPIQAVREVFLGVGQALDEPREIVPIRHRGAGGDEQHGGIVAAAFQRGAQRRHGFGACEANHAALGPCRQGGQEVLEHRMTLKHDVAVAALAHHAAQCI